MRSIIIYIFGYALLVGFFLIEHFVRKGKDTKDMNRTKFDKKSTTFVSIAMGTALILLICSPLLNYLKICNAFNIWVSIIGIILGTTGLIIRYFALSTLGRFFTRILRETENHTLITSGIYKYIRHPGYLSDLLIFIGLSLTMGNWLSLIIVPIMFILAYIYRIHVEEKMLLKIFGEQYKSYQKNSKMIIPYIY
ncbi:MAG: isoprenylcysteine carboxylmethyltransferase family protein [Oscillospiraceae bacterium]|nr:isoprenylcysteine carboxylmethyltransferase family protein [Oscillospiraceae bacterium]